MWQWLFSPGQEAQGLLWDLGGCENSMEEFRPFPEEVAQAKLFSLLLDLE